MYQCILCENVFSEDGSYPYWYYADGTTPQLSWICERCFTILVKHCELQKENEPQQTTLRELVKDIAEIHLNDQQVWNCGSDTEAWMPPPEIEAQLDMPLYRNRVLGNANTIEFNYVGMQLGLCDFMDQEYPSLFIKLPMSTPCPDCGAAVGEPHTEDCDIARCTKCCRQRISCDCRGKRESVWMGSW